MGRNALRVHYLETGGRPGLAGRYHCLLPRQPGPLQAAEGRRVRSVAEDLDRQDPEIRAARPRPRGGVVSETARANCHRDCVVAPLLAMTTLLAVIASEAKQSRPREA